MTNNTNELTHYGILGMKWGKRKARGSSAKSSTKKAKNRNMTAEDATAELERYKRDQRVKSAVKGALGTVGTMAVGTAAAAVGVGGSLYLGFKAARFMLDPMMA